MIVVTSAILLIAEWGGRTAGTAPRSGGVAPGRMWRVSLDEIVSNVIRHGYDRDVHEIVVRLALDDDVMTVQVEDEGKPFNPLAAPPPDLDRPIEERGIGGLGIHIVRHMTDALEYHRVGNRNDGVPPVSGTPARLPRRGAETRGGGLVPMDVDASETRLESSPSHPAGSAGFAPGAMLAGRYRVVSLLGCGGMGEVYRADDLRLNQAVALKFLPAALEQDPAARERLLAEVRHARSVSHPNVCRVHDVGEVNGRCFLTMEYIDGEDLASLLRRIGRLPGAKALEIARQLCAGLAAAHDRGLLHRDLKPANVMIDGRGHARITDFGLAVESRSPGAFNPRTATAEVGIAGTIAYMAPERFEGKPATVQSDLYALGLILYEAYTGKRAITPGLGHPSAAAAPGTPPKTGGLQGEERADVQGLVRDWRRAHADSTPAIPSALVSEIEPAVERVILRCLEKDPSSRPASVAQVAAALPGGDPLAAALAAGETPSPELVAASGEEGTLPRAKAWLLFGACLAAMVLVFAIIGWVSIVNLVPFDQDPDLLRSSARTVLHEFGHVRVPADNASWFRSDPGFPDHLVKSTPPSQRFRPVPETTRGPVFYCYRQSPRPLLPLVPGFVQRDNPPADDADDAYIELDTRGRLVFLRITADPFVARLHGAAGPAWDRIFSLARLDAGRFQPVQPTWTPPGAHDAWEAREGRDGDDVIRVEAAAWQGKTVYVRVVPDWSRPSPAASSAAGTQGAEALMWLITCGLFAFLARRNVVAGRSDRAGALRLAVFMLVTGAVAFAVARHWVFDANSVWTVVLRAQGSVFAWAGIVWIYYLGLEPFVRRRWPRLLIAWTRLLDGRWRDPLVGRSLLYGLLAGLAIRVAAPALVAAGRVFERPDAIPWYDITPIDTAGRFIGGQIMSFGYGVLYAVAVMAVLLGSRLVTRRDGPAWTMTAAIAFVVAFNRLTGLASGDWLVHAMVAALVAAVFLVALLRGGVLTFAVAILVWNNVADVAPTLDVSRWYAWRGFFAAAVLVTLAVWGFRNVLGRQRAFPQGALDV